MRQPLDSTPQRALVHLLNGNVDAARAPFFSVSRHHQLLSDSFVLVAANPRSMQSKYVRKHVGQRRLQFLEDHRVAYLVSSTCWCTDKQPVKGA